jgi:diguanylate cyclase (GGDEF)-like protein/PAS domain S-box-containing protein
MPAGGEVVPDLAQLMGAVSDGVYVTDRGRRVTAWNAAAERITGYRAEEAVGRRCRDGLLCHVDAAGNSLCHGLCPLAGTMRDGAPREALVWLRHAAGHRVAVEVRVQPVRDADGRVVGGLEVFREARGAEPAAEQISELRALALTDPLTGLANRRAGEVEIARRLAVLRAAGEPFGLLIADVDDFKPVNDRFGHAAGDAALRVVGRTLRQACRTSDTPVRWGGDEFVVLVAGDGPALDEVAGRIGALVPCARVRPHDGLRLGVSVGAAAALPRDDAAALVDRADAALYAAKRARRAGRDGPPVSPAGGRTGA